MLLKLHILSANVRLVDFRIRFSCEIESNMVHRANYKIFVEKLAWYFVISVFF